MKQRKLYGLLLWVLVLFGYFLFVFNWVSMNTLSGKAGVGGYGWINAFFDLKPNAKITQAINYTITLMRGLGAIGAGYVIAKLGHKKSILIALGLLSLAFPTIFAGYIKGSLGYSIFIIGRMFMAIGGTVLIVYIQPIISRFFKKEHRSKFSVLNSIGFNFGAAIPLIIVCIPGVQKTLSENWQLYGGIIAAFPIILLIVYFFVAEEIDISNASNKNEKVNKHISWIQILKEWKTWKYVIYFGSWLVFVVAPILIFKTPFMHLRNINLHMHSKSWEVLLPIIMFLLGFVPGIWLVGWVGKTNIDRRTYIFTVTIIALICMISSYLCMVYIRSIIPSTIFMFISGIAIWGIQGISLNIPHEEKNQTPKKLSILFGMIWGFGYIFYTIINFLIASIEDIVAVKNNSDMITNWPLVAWVIFGFYIFICILVPLTALILPKTKNKKLLSIFLKLKNT